MRAALGILGLFLLLPTAAADLSMRIESPPPAMPLASAAVARYALTADCEPTLPGAPPRSVHLWVIQKPAWATVAISPSTVAIDCARGTVEKEGAISVAITPEAPAFAPASVDVGLAYEGGVGSNARAQRPPSTSRPRSSASSMRSFPSPSSRWRPARRRPPSSTL